MEKLSLADRQQLQKKGITEESLRKQLNGFKAGFPFARLVAPALSENGVQTLGEARIGQYRSLYRKKAENERILKFVPASGAATRMFKNLYSFYQVCMAPNASGPGAEAREFLDNLSRFAFYEDLKASVEKDTGKGLDEVLAEKNYAAVLRNLLEDPGLGYGYLPKALLKFHRYAEGSRTAVEEHLAEAALYASSNGICHLHFTLSPEHRKAFAECLKKVLPEYETRYGVRYQISTSEQKESTDTVAVTSADQIFRDKEGHMLFRPGGHGALIENLGEQEADLIFIKNIDNITTEDLRGDTQTYKELLAGVLLERRDAVHAYLARMEQTSAPTESFLQELKDFAYNSLFLRFAEGFDAQSPAARLADLKQRFNRPIRVCGVVKNTGEPGGGPFWVLSHGEDAPSLQIVESSQVDMADEEQRRIFEASRYFNPVDLVCSIYDYRRNRFSLSDFIDPQTAFITKKSVQGTDIKAMELPGLWNGAMARWITIFVEVPQSVFTPVKTVNDLLRPQHQTNF